MAKIHVRTLRALIAELTAFAIDNPGAADQPAGFTLDCGDALAKGEATIYYVMDISVDPDNGGLLMTRGLR